MTAIDFTTEDVAASAPSIVSTPIRGGYRVSPQGKQRLHAKFIRYGVGLMLSGLLTIAVFYTSISPVQLAGGDPGLLKALLIGGLFAGGTFLLLGPGASLLPHHVDVNLTGRVLNLAPTGSHAKARVLRFEEIVRFDVEEGSGVTDIYQMFSKLDYGRLSARLEGGRTVLVVAGDVTELQSLLRDLRADTGIA